MVVLPLKPTPKAYIVLLVVGTFFAIGFSGISLIYSYSVGLLLATLVLGLKNLVEKYGRDLEKTKVEVDLEEKKAVENSIVRVIVRVEGGEGAGLLELEASERIELEPSSPVVVNLADDNVVFRARVAIGRWSLGPAKLTVGDPLGFFQYTRVLGERVWIYGYPSVLFESSPKSRLELYGVEEVYSRLRRGSSIEFYEIREYIPGDDPRRIVWTATARTGKLMVRDDLAELRLRLFIILDLSLDMWIGAIGRSPGEQASRVAASIGYYISRKSGLLGYTIYRGGRWRISPTRYAREAYYSLYSEIASFNPLEDSMPRIRLDKAISESLEYAKYSTLLVLTGPSRDPYSFATSIKRVVAKFPGYTMILVFPPAGRGRVLDKARNIAEATATILSRELRGTSTSTYFVENIDKLQSIIKGVIRLGY